MEIKLRNWKFWIFFYFGVLLFFFSFSSLHIRLGPSSLKLEDQTDLRVPKNMSKTVEEIDDWFSDEEKEKVVYYSDINIPKKSAFEIHESMKYGYLGTGGAVRSAFGLLSDSRLKRWFIWRAKTHPDDMSQVVLEQYANYVRGEPVSELYLNRTIVLLILSSVVFVLLYSFAVLYKIGRFLLGNKEKLKGPKWGDNHRYR